MLEFSFCTGALIWFWVPIFKKVSRKGAKKRMSRKVSLRLCVFFAALRETAFSCHKFVRRVLPGARARGCSERVASCQARTPGQPQMCLTQCLLFCPPLPAQARQHRDLMPLPCHQVATAVLKRPR